MGNRGRFVTKPITVALIDIVDILIMNGRALALLGILEPLVSLPPLTERRLITFFKVRIEKSIF